MEFMLFNPGTAAICCDWIPPTPWFAMLGRDIAAAIFIFIGMLFVFPPPLSFIVSLLRLDFAFPFLSEVRENKALALLFGGSLPAALFLRLLSSNGTFL